MRFELLYVIFVVVTVLNYIFLDIKVEKLKKEIIEKDKVISAFVALDKAISKLNTGFKDHEQRIKLIEEFLLSENPEEPEKHKYTCKDCKFYHPYERKKGFSSAVNYYKCEKLNMSFPIVCDTACPSFDEKEDEDENVVYYANNVKVDISSKKPDAYTADRILTYKDISDRICKLFLDGGISAADMYALLERLKQ